MKPSSANRFHASIAFALASFTVAAPADTVTVPLSPVADTRIFDADWGRDNNDGSGSNLGIYQSRDRSLLRFDFGQVPAGASISSSILHLTATDTFGGNPNAESMNIHRLTQAWTEGGVTWNKYDGTNAWPTAGGNYDGTPYATSTANAGSGQAITWDLSTLVQDWVTSAYPNEGLIIINSGGTNGLHFASKEHGTAAYRPYLATSVTTPTTPPTGSWTWNGGDGATAPVDGSGTWTDTGKWWNGSATATWADGNDAIFGAGSGTAGTVTITSTVVPKSLWFQAAGSGNYTLTGGAIGLGGGYRIIQTDADASIASALANGGLIKQGSSKLTLSGTNTYAGATVVSAGTVSLAGASSLPASSSASIAAGAKLSNDAPANTSFNLGLLTLTGGELAATASPAWNLGNFHLMGDVTVSGNSKSTISADVRVLFNQNRIFNVASTGDPSGVDLLLLGKLGHYNNNSWGYATKAGAGTMKLTATPEIGGLTVNAGKLILEDAAADWSTFEGSNGGLKNNSQVEISVTTGSRSMPVTVSGTGTLTKTGAGTATLTGSTTHSGGTTVLAGTLSLGNGSTSNNLSPVVIAPGGAQMNLNFTGTDEVGSLSLGGSDAGSGTFNASSHPAYFTGTGSLVVFGQNDGIWTSATDGNWGVPANWQDNIVASRADKTATFNGATGTTVTLEADRVIGNLAFSGLDYAITGSSRTLTLSSSTSSTINVAADRTAIINSLLKSSNPVIKTGNGTIRLNAGAGDNYANVYNHSLGGIDIQAGTVELNSQFIRLGAVNIATGATLLASVPWATGASNPWFNGRSVGPITVQNGGTLTAINGAVGNSIMEGLTLLGGSVTAPGFVSADWGAFVLASTLTADGPATSAISADFAVTGTQRMDVVTGSTLLVTGDLHNRYASTGGITKDGDGTLVFTGVKSYTGPTAVLLGTLQLGDGTTDGSAPYSPITNNASLVLHPAGNLNFSQTISGYGSLTKTGSTTVAITGPQNYTGDTIVNAGGTLELQNNSASAVTATLQNAGFESPDYSGGAWSYLPNDGIIAWTFATGGIASNGSPWVNTAPEGDQAGFIQNTGSMSQTITVPANGDYVVTFQSANRPGYSPSDLSVAIDATTVGSWTAAQLNTGGNFATRSSNSISLTAGSHTLTFTGTQVGGDSATAIDAVSVTSPVTNGRLTFEPTNNDVSNKVTGSGTAVLNGQFYLNLAFADLTNGNSWMLVDHASLIESYGTNFSVTSNLGAFANEAGTWKLTNGQNTWTFNPSNGRLSLAIVEDPFLDWISEPNWPGLTDRSATGDPDNDGIVNLIEYVLQGGDPSVSNTGILPTVDASGSNFIFTFYRRAAATGTTQVFQFGSTLSGWTDVPVVNGGQVAITPNTPTAGIEQVVITVPKGASTTLFGRLQVVK